jgi:hypothetical protein
MSAFTRLYYANRGLDRYGIDDSYLYPFEDASHGPPAPIASPEDPYGDPEPIPYGDVQAPGPELRRPHADAWWLQDAVRARTQT